MGIYGRFILPRLTHLAMRRTVFGDYRRRLLGGAEGRVLEIGVGSGLNLPFYGQHVTRLVGVDPSGEMIRLARDAAAAAPFQSEFLEQPAESLPLSSGSIDTAVTTWSLCTIPEPVRALEEVRRVLVPGGRLLFVEHGLAPDASVAKWQDRLTPLWKRCAGGCHLNRRIDAIIRDAGFALETLDTEYMRGRRSMAYLFLGSARPH